MSSPWLVAVVTLWVVVLTLVFLNLGVVRRLSVLTDLVHSRLQPIGPEGLDPGSVVPPFRARDPAAGVVESGDLIGSPILFVFLKPGCAPCQGLVDELRLGSQELPPVRVVAVMDDVPESGSWIPLPGVQALLDADGSASRAFHNSAVPQAFAVDPGGKVTGRRVANSIGDLRELARSLDDQRGRGAEPDPETAHGPTAGRTPTEVTA
jgi:hypothetical protein